MVYRIDRVALLEPVFRLMQNNPPTKPQSPTLQRLNNENLANIRGTTPPLSPKPLSRNHSSHEIKQAVEIVAEKEPDVDAPKDSAKDTKKDFTVKDTIKEREIFDFAKGQHDSALLPTCSSFFAELAKEATIEERDNEENSKKWFQYSNEDGDLEIRDEIAKYFSKKFGLTTPISRDNLYITSGTTQALHLTLTFLSRQFNTINNIMEVPSLRNSWKYESTDYDNANDVPKTFKETEERNIDEKLKSEDNIQVNSNDNNKNTQENSPKRKVIICEELTYHQAIKVINDEGFEIEGFETDSNGLNIEKLKYQFENHLREIPFAIYIIPSFSNPTSYSLSLYRKILLLQLAHHYNFYIISDDTYQFLSFSPPSFIPLQIFDHFQLSIKSFVDRNHQLVNQLHQLENLHHSSFPNVNISNSNFNNSNNSNRTNDNKRPIIHNINRESLNYETNINLINKYLNEDTSILSPVTSKLDKNIIDTIESHEKSEEKRKLSLPLICIELYLLQRDKIDEKEGKVISLNSFSKILFPGFQIAFLYSNAHLIQQIGNMGSEFDLSSIPFVSRLLMGCIRSGILEKTMERYRSSYSQRCKVMCDCLDLLIQTLEISHEISMTFTRPKGGFFVWLTVIKPSDFDAEDFLDFCSSNPIDKFPLIEYAVTEDRNIIHNDSYSNGDDSMEKFVIFESGSKFCCKRNGVRNCLRLSFAPLSPKKIHEGISLLLALFYRYFAASTPSLTLSSSFSTS